ncbi:MAG: hypothetical protein K2M91_12060, partial [Lachnospiraceae bacterium]|nr:hypothetical protein [Lachnospiraceae bacterium]
YYLYYWLISLYQLTLTGIFVSFSKNYTNLVMWLGLLLVGMSFSVDIIMFFFIQQLHKKQAIEAEMKELYHSHQQNLELYKDIEAQLRTLREQRHEFSNQLQTAYMMINQNAPTEQIVKYLSHIEKQCRSN